MTIKLKINFRKYAAILLLWVFITPLIIKTFHHHEELFVCTAKAENHYHNHHETCPICNYEFSVFPEKDIFLQIEVNRILNSYVFGFISFSVLKPDHLISLLRAPPVIL